MKFGKLDMPKKSMGKDEMFEIEVGMEPGEGEEEMAEGEEMPPPDKKGGEGPQPAGPNAIAAKLSKEYSREELQAALDMLDSEGEMA